jgi:hypothetical protein
MIVLEEDEDGACVLCFEHYPVSVYHCCQPSVMCEACLERFQVTQGLDTLSFHRCPLCLKDTVESEWTPVWGKSCTQPPVKTINGTTSTPQPYMMVLQRRRNYPSGHTLTGYPFLVPVPVLGITGAQLHELVAEYLGNSGVEVSGVLYSLKLFDEYGGTCKNCNLYSCDGCSCIAPTNDVIRVPPSMSRH